MIGFEGVVDDRANESWELGVLFAFTSLWINGRLCVRVLATGVGEFGSLGRGFLPITRILNSIRFLLAFVNDATVYTVFLLAIDNVATLAERAVDLRNGMVKGNLCYSFGKLKGFKSSKSFKSILC